MKKLGELTSGDLLSSGIYPGLDGVSPPLWADGENVIFDGLGVRKNYGLLLLDNLASTPTGLRSTFANSEARAFVGAGSEAYVYRSGSGLTNIGSFSAAAGVFQFVPWDTWCLINNTVDPVELWQNAGTSAPITAPFTRANVIFSMGLRAFAAGTSNGEDYVEWTSLNSMTSWTPTLLNSAGNLRLRDLVGAVVAAAPLGNSMGIYSSYNAGIFSQLGGTANYGFRRPIRGVSAISPYSVVSLGDRHYGITKENAFVTDLVSFQYIDEPAMRKYLLDNVDWTRAAEVYGWPDWSNSIVRWSLPKNDGTTFGIGFRFDRGTWTRFNDGVRLGEQSGAFANMLLATQSKLLRQDKSQHDNDNAALPSFIQTKPLDFGERNQFKRIQKICVNGQWSGDVRIKVGYTNTPNETITSWAFDKALSSEVYPDEEGIQAEGPFVTIRIETTATDTNWNLSGATIYGEYTGLVS